MTDRFRYLPCGLHEALRPELFGPGFLFPESGGLHVDLATGAGWDHAVRACCAIEGISIAESRTPAPPDEVNDLAWGTPEQRREALCRCICAALGLDVGAVFPVERS